MSAAHRWTVLAGLLAASLGAAAWVHDATDDADSTIAEAVSARKERGPQPPPAREYNRPARETSAPAAQIELQRLAARSAGALLRDPFAAPISAPPRHAAARAKPRSAPPRPGAPPLPFAYMGRLRSGDETTIFLTEGERNLVLHEGDTIDSVYRVEHIADSSITLLYLPLGQRQRIALEEPK